MDYRETKWLIFQGLNLTGPVIAYLIRLYQWKGYWTEFTNEPHFAIAHYWRALAAQTRSLYTVN